MSNKYNSRIITKTDTYANWSAANPVLLAGELVVATACDGVNTRLKLGDGATNFNSLPFLDDEMLAAIAELYNKISQSVVVYVGSGTPSNTLGNNGDIYVDVG